MEISRTLVEIDRVCDYIPFVSTATNLIDLFLKTIFSIANYFSQDGHKLCENHYVAHLHDDKSVGYCFLLLIPIIGNLIAHSQLFRCCARENKTFNRVLDALEPFTGVQYVSNDRARSGNPLSLREYKLFLDLHIRHLTAGIRTGDWMSLLADGGAERERQCLNKAFQAYGIEERLELDAPLLKKRRKMIALQSEAFALKIAAALDRLEQFAIRFNTDENRQRDHIDEMWWELRRPTSQNFPSSLHPTLNDEWNSGDVMYVELEGDPDQIIDAFIDLGGTVSDQTRENFTRLVTLSTEIRETRNGYY